MLIGNSNVPGYGGYSYYTTCMLDTDAGNQIVYRDAYPEAPDGDNVWALLLGGVPVDFADATTHYRRRRRTRRASPSTGRSRR